ncbi:tyrosine-type recombinase/integrase [Clostridium beijerinckii]|nr:tyrosine-type recombinase/integrase [Parabacteroides distasonis]MZK52110.1 tyrosine-type recombinase/integrase [Clostridium beijerinckii]MZK61269.1 tyrosine-type recombinase/integrase [Clostridium beijerinckii]MZK71512.1 tyrosine-type recombinase/integrase [Clostridium beijerinckii]MZK76871.1 tyrosine-type recombinase/integrase [Clostridium beijerinckii]
MENSNSSHSIRDLSIFSLAYRCGLRASEIALLKLQDYNMSKGEIYCKRLKGSNNNTLRLDEKTKAILDKFINQNNIKSESQIIFTSQKNNPISRQTLDYLTNIYFKMFYTISNIRWYIKHHLN